jgi:hypothetical protein
LLANYGVSHPTIMRLWSDVSAHARLDVLDPKWVGPPREELVELRLGGPDKLVLQVTELYNGGAHYEVHATL